MLPSHDVPGANLERGRDEAHLPFALDAHAADFAVVHSCVGTLGTLGHHGAVVRSARGSGAVVVDGGTRGARRDAAAPSRRLSVALRRVWGRCRGQVPRDHVRVGWVGRDGGRGWTRVGPRVSSPRRIKFGAMRACRSWREWACVGTYRRVRLGLRRECLVGEVDLLVPGRRRVLGRGRRGGHVQKRHGTSVLPLRRIDTRAPVMEGDGPRVCALVCPLPVCARSRFSGDSRVRGGPLACVAVPVWGRGRAGASGAGPASRGKIARPTVGFLFWDRVKT